MKQIKIFLIIALIVSCSSNYDDDGYGSNNYNNNNNNQSSVTGYNISVTSNGMSDYKLSGKDRDGNVSGNDPGIKFKVGDQISFMVTAAGHPFYLKTKASLGTGDQFSGVSNNGTVNGNVTWKPSSAGTYYYVCSKHSNMFVVITVVN